MTPQWLLEHLKQLLVPYVGEKVATIIVTGALIFYLIHVWHKRRMAEIQARQPDLNQKKTPTRTIWRTGETCEIEGEYTATCNPAHRQTFAIGDIFPVTLTQLSTYNHDGRWRLTDPAP